MSRLEGVQSISRWGIEHALVTESGAGLSRTPNGPGAERRGWEIFGLTDVDPAIWKQ